MKPARELNMPSRTRPSVSLLVSFPVGHRNWGWISAHTCPLSAAFINPFWGNSVQTLKMDSPTGTYMKLWLFQSHGVGGSLVPGAEDGSSEEHFTFSSQQGDFSFSVVLSVTTLCTGHCRPGRTLGIVEFHVYHPPKCWVDSDSAERRPTALTTAIFSKRALCIFTGERTFHWKNNWIFYLDFFGCSNTLGSWVRVW